MTKDYYCPLTMRLSDFGQPHRFVYVLLSVICCFGMVIVTLLAAVVIGRLRTEI